MPKSACPLLCIAALMLASFMSSPLCAQAQTVPLPDSVSSPGHAGRSQSNMVASVHPLATKAGVKAFEAGGNAVDAVIATALTLGVVDGYNSGIGGGCFILIRRPDGKIFAIDGREMAPAAAHRDMYLRNGQPDGARSRIGPLAVGVPGALMAYHEAVSEFGELEFKNLILPAATIAESGFPVSAAYAQVLRDQQENLRRFPASAAALLKDDGTAYRVGDVLKQADLAASYRAIAKHGIEWFYGGTFAQWVGDWMQGHGGILTQADLANYKTVRRTPVRTRYREYEIVGFPPPSSGGAHVAQILNMLEPFDVARIHRDDPAQLHHLVAEAMKRAFADRAYWLGDPDFVDVPRQLIGKPYANSLMESFHPNRATAVASHGHPPAAATDLFERHTTHVAAADAQGNWVAMTTTVNTRFGSKVIIPKTGIVLNNQMDDFSIAPGVPNAYGLIGSERNAIAAGKRPLSSMSPTIVLKNGKPVLTVGAAGGPRIITQAVLAIINRLDLGMPLRDAVAAKRIHHQWSPDRLYCEKGMHPDLVESLQGKGHRIQLSENVGVTQAIGFDEASNMFAGVHDPRVQGLALGQQESEPESQK